MKLISGTALVVACFVVLGFIPALFLAAGWGIRSQFDRPALPASQTKALK